MSFFCEIKFIKNCVCARSISVLPDFHFFYISFFLYKVLILIKNRHFSFLLTQAHLRSTQNLLTQAHSEFTDPGAPQKHSEFTDPGALSEFTDPGALSEFTEPGALRIY
jgi:hypothetical protein